ncbi:protein kinase domain-containing protein [Streptomyces griseorubiginosus]|uniref:serine/threonine-protein kinase n=1 Tax=Streptomyces griseorubiginosus TaxID=67304 RepID=UPI003F55087E
MGRVWRAADEMLDRQVAVKEMRIDGLDAEDTRTRRERTLREARATARIDHPNVVRVYDVVDEGERLWIVMELVKGRSLERMMVEDGPLDPRATALLGLGLVEALRQVHARGVLHRDIKPGNVLVESGSRTGRRIVLTDFGIAAMQDAKALTMVGMLVGSPDYMAPERVSGRPQGPPSDIWSLGATLCAALGGRSPFSRDTTLATLHAVLYEEPELPAAAGPLTDILAALLEKDPSIRPGLDEVESALHTVAFPAPTPTLRVGPVQDTEAEGVPGTAGAPGTPGAADPGAAPGSPDLPDGPDEAEETPSSPWAPRESPTPAYLEPRVVRAVRDPRVPEPFAGPEPPVREPSDAVPVAFSGEEGDPAPPPKPAARPGADAPPTAEASPEPPTTEPERRPAPAPAEPSAPAHPFAGAGHFAPGEGAARAESFASDESAASAEGPAPVDSFGGAERPAAEEPSASAEPSGPAHPFAGAGHFAPAERSASPESPVPDEPAASAEGPAPAEPSATSEPFSHAGPSASPERAPAEPPPSSGPFIAAGPSASAAGHGASASTEGLSEERSEVRSEAPSGNSVGAALRAGATTTSTPLASAPTQDSLSAGAPTEHYPMPDAPTRDTPTRAASAPTRVGPAPRSRPGVSLIRGHQPVPDRYQGEDPDPAPAGGSGNSAVRAETPGTDPGPAPDTHPLTDPDPAPALVLGPHPHRVPPEEPPGEAELPGPARPARPATPHRPRRRTALVAAGTVVTAAAVVVAVILATTSGSPGDDKADGSPSSSTSASASVAEPGGSTPAGTPSSTVEGTSRPRSLPPGAHEEAGGFAWATPTGWRRDVKTGAEVHYTSPDGKQELAAKSSLARGDLMETWETSEQNAHQGQDYRKIRLEETTFRDHPAVVWEYTFTLGGVPWHAQLLGFNEGDKSYQINTWYQPDIEPRALKTYEKVKDSFTVL